jgi:hypothetical protein
LRVSNLRPPHDLVENVPVSAVYAVKVANAD